MKAIVIAIAIAEKNSAGISLSSESYARSIHTINKKKTKPEQHTKKLLIRHLWSE